MKLARNIVFSILKLSEHRIDAYRKIVHKILYLSLKEHRKELYEIFYYGPFSDSVQVTLQSLVTTKYIKAVENRYQLIQNTFAEKEINITELMKGDPNTARIQTVVEFCNENNLKTMEEISNLVNIHYLLVRNKFEWNESNITFLKTTSRYLGWPTIENMPVGRQKKYFELSSELESQLA